MFKNAVEVFDIFGFKVRIDPSWLLIAALIIWSLSSSYFPQNLPGYTRYDYLALGTVAMLGLFASLILHELSHSLVARRFGLKVGNITLFIFGGVAELEQEPRSPKSEFWIAIAGPLMSYALAVLAWFTGSVLAGLNASAPLRAVFDYLALINIILGTFNLVPAFPLDGGRIFRAVLWHFKQDLLAATKIASSFGTVFGFVLIASGVFALFSASAVGGLWQILIGFFVVTASRSSYQQLLISRALKDQTIRSVMTRDVATADAEDSVQSVVDKVMLGQNRTFVPVVEGEHLLGYVTTELVQKIDRENWANTKLGDIYIAASAENTVDPDIALEEVFTRMARSGQRKLLVESNGALSGIIALSDLMTYLAIRNGLGTGTSGRTAGLPTNKGISGTFGSSA